MLHRMLVPLLILAGCSADPHDQKSTISGAEVSESRSAYQVAGQGFRALPRGIGSWTVAPKGNLVAAIPRTRFEQLIDLPRPARSQSGQGDVWINIGDADEPDVLLEAMQPLQRAGDYAGLERSVSRTPGVQRPGDFLNLPAPYNGRIHCPHEALATQAAACEMVIEREGLRHSVSILPEQVPHWRAFAEAYLRLINKLEA